MCEANSQHWAINLHSANHTGATNVAAVITVTLPMSADGGDRYRKAVVAGRPLFIRKAQGAVGTVSHEHAHAGWYFESQAGVP